MHAQARRSAGTGHAQGGAGRGHAEANGKRRQTTSAGQGHALGGDRAGHGSAGRRRRCEEEEARVTEKHREVRWGAPRDV